MTVIAPHNLEAEKAILGAVLINGSAGDLVAERVRPRDFYRDAHQRIFRGMLMLADRGSAIDFVTLRDELRRSGDLEEVGGPAYITSLADGVPRSTNVQDYARVVKEAALARDVCRLSTEAQQAFSKNPSALANGMGKRFADAIGALVADAHAVDQGLPDDAIEDAVQVIQEGRDIAASGIQYVVPGIIPNYGMVGMMVAYAKVGKSTIGQQMAAAVAMGRPFIDRTVTACRVLDIAAEDPAEYTAYTARNLDVGSGRLSFYRRPILVDRRGLGQITETVRRGHYGLVRISSWQAVTRGLIRDENDNAGAVRVVEDVKAAARETGVPWLIDAHAGKAENQDDDADPTMAMRGASAAAGAADFMLSFRYANGPFGTQRRLSGKGRFVSFAPITLDFDIATSTYTVIGDTKTAATETVWRLMVDTGALSTEARTAAEIAEIAGLGSGGSVTSTHRKQVQAALRGRQDVGIEQTLRRGQKTTTYKLLTPEIRK